MVSTLLFDLDMITEDYVSFEVAKLLKEKGFDIPYDSFRGVYINGVFKRLNPGAVYGFNDGDEIINVCSLQMAMKWLREKNDIAIEINVGSGSKDCWVSNVIKGYKTENGTYIRTFVKFSYEEACEAAIKYCLENLI